MKLRQRLIRVVLLCIYVASTFELSFMVNAQSIKEQMCDLSVKELKRNGDNAMMKKKYEDAVDIYSLLVEREPEVERHLYKRSQAFEKMKKFRNAISDLGKLLTLNPSYTSGLNLRARINLAMGWCLRAWDDYKQVLNLKPSHGDAKNKLPQAQECNIKLNEINREKAKGEHDKVERMLDDLITSHGKAPNFLFLRAESRFEQEKYYEAIADLGALLKKSPGETEALYMRAVSYYYLTEYDAVKKHIKEIMRYDQDHVKARSLNKLISNYGKAMKKAKAAAEGGNFEEAINFFEEAVAVDSSHKAQVLGTYTEACEFLMQMKNIDEAAKYCEAALSESHEKQLEICLKYAGYHLNGCDSDADFDLNQRLWGKCREANGDQDNREIQEGLRKQQSLYSRWKKKDRDYYGILGVRRDATSSEIKKKYRKLAREMHPDKFAGKPEAEQKEAERKFQRVVQSYEVLSDEDMRRRYDMGEDVEDPSSKQRNARGFHGFPFQFRRAGGQNFHFNF